MYSNTRSAFISPQKLHMNRSAWPLECQHQQPNTTRVSQTDGLCNLHTLSGNNRGSVSDRHLGRCGTPAPILNLHGIPSKYYYISCTCWNTSYLYTTNIFFRLTYFSNLSFPKLWCIHFIHLYYILYEYCFLFKHIFQKLLKPHLRPTDNEFN